MPLGVNRTDLNKTATSYKNGFPVTLPLNVGNPISEPVNFGNPIPSSGTNENTVDWVPSPAHFGNDIGGGTPPPGGGIKFLAATTTEIASGGTGDSAAIDTTGASLLVVVVSGFTGAGAFTDSKGNSWTALTTYASTPFCFATIYYCFNPVVGPGHTVSDTSGTGQSNVAMAAFSGSKTTSAVFEAGSDVGASAGSTPVQPGSVTPASVGDLIVTGFSGIADSIGGMTCDSGFTVIQPSTVKRWEVGLAYLLVTSAVATNPAWNGATGFQVTANAAVFAKA